jgi:hypothetical protein
MALTKMKQGDESKGTFKSKGFTLGQVEMVNLLPKDTSILTLCHC